MALETLHQQILVKGSEVTIQPPQCNFYGAIVANRLTCHMLLKYDNYECFSGRLIFFLKTYIMLYEYIMMYPHLRLS